MKKENVPVIRELDSVSSRKIFQLNLDSDIMAIIKMLANLNGDSAKNMVNDILRAFVDRNKDVLENFQNIAVSTYKKINW